VLAADLFRLVLLDAVCAGVPTDDAAVRIEHEDGVVLHAGHQQAKQLFALPQRLLVCPAPGEIARHFAEPAQLAARVAQRGDHRAGPESRTVLADAPSLVLDAPLTCGDFELALGLSRREVLRRVENREVLADRFRGLVADDA